MAFLHLFRLKGSPFKPSHLSCQRFGNWVWSEKFRESGLTQDSSFRRLTLLGGTIFFHINGAWNEKSSIQFENVYSNSLDQLHVSRVVLGTSEIFCFLLFLFFFFCLVFALFSTHYHIAFQIRQNIINSITQLKINDTESVNQIASVLVEATKVEGEITPQSGVSVDVCGEISFWIHCTEWFNSYLARISLLRTPR